MVNTPGREASAEHAPPSLRPSHFQPKSSLELLHSPERVTMGIRAPLPPLRQRQRKALASYILGVVGRGRLAVWCMREGDDGEGKGGEGRGGKGVRSIGLLVKGRCRDFVWERMGERGSET